MNARPFAEVDDEARSDAVQALLESRVPKVYLAISAVMEEIAGTGGIPKAQTNTGQGYKFRGIDDVIEKLSPLLVKHRLLILPQGETHSIEDYERERENGGVALSFKSSVRIKYKFISLIDGSTDYVTVFGEAADSGDKATNKAHSAAYKLMAIQSFCIPTGDPKADTESEDHELNRRASPQKEKQSRPPCPNPDCEKGSFAVIEDQYGQADYACYRKRGGCGVKFNQDGSIQA